MHLPDTFSVLIRARLAMKKCDVTTISMNDFIEGKFYGLVVQHRPLKDKKVLTII